jgi:hypothetical protein
MSRPRVAERTYGIEKVNAIINMRTFANVF